MYLMKLQWEHNIEEGSVRFLISKEIFEGIAEENEVILDGGRQEEDYWLVEVGNKDGNGRSQSKILVLLKHLGRSQQRRGLL